jgi:hypothetical protein
LTALTRFLGDSPLRVLVKLIVLSLVVGLFMSVFDFTPWDFWYALRDAVLHVWYMGFDAIDRFLGYIVLGAVVVIPVFFVLRVLSYRR